MGRTNRAAMVRRWRLIVWLGLFLAGPPDPTLLAHGDLHEQIEVISFQLARDPTSVPLLLRRAELHRLHGDWADALKDLDRAQALRPIDAPVDLARGKVLQDAGRPDAARHAMDQFLARQPGHIEGLLARARLLMSQGDSAAAADDLARAIDLSPRPEPEYYLERATALRRIQPPRLMEALASLDSGLAKLGPIVTLQLAALDIEVALGKYQAALQRLDQMRPSGSRQETWLVRRAGVLELAGRCDEAQQAREEALRAIEALPPPLRRTPATISLEQSLRSRASGTDQTDTAAEPL